MNCPAVKVLGNWFWTLTPSPRQYLAQGWPECVINASLKDNLSPLSLQHAKIWQSRKTRNLTCLSSLISRDVAGPYICYPGYRGNSEWSHQSFRLHPNLPAGTQCLVPVTQLNSAAVAPNQDSLPIFTKPGVRQEWCKYDFHPHVRLGQSQGIW